MGAETILLGKLREGGPLSLGQRLSLIVRLSIPAILSQITYIVMVYIDASMVGRLGAESSAAVGLMSTSEWLFGGLISAASIGFTVQVAHLVGANDFKRARDVLRQGFVSITVFCLALVVIAASLSPFLPRWLGGDESITGMASSYFLIFALALPTWQFCRFTGGMLQSTGNMRVPSALNIAMCVLDVIFNFLLIFPSREISVFGCGLHIWGAGLGVTGAALGTALASLVGAIVLTYYVCFRSKILALTQERGVWRPTRDVIARAFRIGIPVGLERVIMCGAQIATTAIIAPLGNIAIAANSFAVTAESLCYMPGYGIGDAATTLVGQSVGAKRKDLVRQFANLTVICGIAVMTFMGAVMYIAAPLMLGIMTPVREIMELGTEVLRIEAFAEPMFAASIVAYSAFVGTGDTVAPACMNFFSIWIVRVGLAIILTPLFGLRGAWIAMCAELCFRGFIFLWRLVRGRWLAKLSLSS